MKYAIEIDGNKWFYYRWKWLARMHWILAKLDCREARMLGWTL